MKTFKSIFAALLIMVTSLFAFQASANDDKLVEKARTAVSSASPDDWYTLASWAEKCIKKGVNLKEAAEWLDKSISIKETAYNLSVKGDYYVANKLPEKALETYIRSIELGRTDEEFDMQAVQNKITKLISKK
ncbi:MAG: hypothetical protein OHK0038_12280 [Flammeovirgaceae bacterium]